MKKDQCGLGHVAAIESACRASYDNHFHKIPGIDYDHWRAAFKAGVLWGRNDATGDWADHMARMSSALLAESAVQQFEHITDERIKAAFHKYGTGRLDGFTAAVRALLAERAAQPVQAEPVGEMVGHHRVGMGEMPTIQWREGYWPTVGAKFYVAPPLPHPDTERLTVPPEIAALIERLHTQDNRITDNPLFAVQQRRRVYGVDEERRDGVEADADGMPCGYVDRWEFVTGCMTEQGCKDFIRVNGHNLNEPRIYAYGSYRNAEFIALRKWLMSLRQSDTARAAGMEEA